VRTIQRTLDRLTLARSPIDRAELRLWVLVLAVIAAF
jgi:hypothetical protein